MPLIEKKDMMCPSAEAAQIDSSKQNKKPIDTGDVNQSASSEGKSVITLAGNLAIGGGNFIVINTTDGKENIEEILEGINKISPNAITRVIEALADKISREK
jgi:hypothetical protein